MDKYIFLDIDGVLNSNDWFEKNKDVDGLVEIDPSKLKLLKEIVDCTEAKIILSSSWRSLGRRDDKPDNEIYTYLLNSLKQFGLSISDHTPYLNQNRPREIKEWLKKNCDINNTRFISLDDDYRYSDYCQYGIEDCLIRTSFYEKNGGLQRRHVDKAIEILNGEYMV